MSDAVEESGTYSTPFCNTLCRKCLGRADCDPAKLMTEQALIPKPQPLATRTARDADQHSSALFATPGPVPFASIRA